MGDLITKQYVVSRLKIRWNYTSVLYTSIWWGA